MNIENENQLTELLSAGTPFVLDFWAEWCKPCLAMKKTISENRDQLQVEVYYVNVDEMPDVAANYGIRGIPALVRFDGVDPKPTNQSVGALPLAKLIEFCK